MRTLIAITIGYVMSIAGTGCSPVKKIYPVEGTVTFDDGSAKELVGGHVSFESVEDHSNAAGEILAGGQYRMTGPIGINGVPPGKYRVLVMPPEPKDPDNPPPAVFPERYRSYENSGIEVTVEEKLNNIPIKLHRK